MVVIGEEVKTLVFGFFSILLRIMYMLYTHTHCMMVSVYPWMALNNNRGWVMEDGCLVSNQNEKKNHSESKRRRKDAWLYKCVVFVGSIGHMTRLSTCDP